MTGKSIALIFLLMVGAFASGIAIYHFSRKQSAPIIKTDNVDTRQYDRVIDSVKKVINEKLDSVQVIANSKTIIRNYYAKKSNEIDTLTTDSLLVRFIRDQLSCLGASRLDTVKLR